MRLDTEIPLTSLLSNIHWINYSPPLMSVLYP